MIWTEGNKIDNLLQDMQTDAGGHDKFIENLKRRRKVLKQLKEIVDKHYTRRVAEEAINQIQQIVENHYNIEEQILEARLDELFGVDAYIIKHRNGGLEFASTMFYTEARRKELKEGSE